MFLRIAPELYLKRLLVGGFDRIFELNRNFRNEGLSRHHNPEFTMIEWYRPGRDDHELMDEVEALVARLLKITEFWRISYRELWLESTGTDPHLANLDELRRLAKGLRLTPLDLRSRNDYLDLIMAQHVEKRLADMPAVFVTDYPASQAALARIRPGTPPTAARFELFLRGLEIANGYHELLDPAEHRRRFREDLEFRRAEGRLLPSIDEKFLEAISSGLPECAGVALGFDRLLMVAVDTQDIRDVLAFPIERA